MRIDEYRCFEEIPYAELEQMEQSLNLYLSKLKKELELRKEQKDSKPFYQFTHKGTLYHEIDYGKMIDKVFELTGDYDNAYQIKKVYGIGEF